MNGNWFSCKLASLTIIELFLLVIHFVQDNRSLQRNFAVEKPVSCAAQHTTPTTNTHPISDVLESQLILSLFVALRSSMWWKCAPRYENFFAYIRVSSRSASRPPLGMVGIINFFSLSSPFQFHSWLQRERSMLGGWATLFLHDFFNDLIEDRVEKHTIRN